MYRSSVVSFMLFVSAISGCADGGDDQDATAEDDVFAVAEAESGLTAPAGCTPLFAIARPVAAPHYHDPALQQSAGKLTMFVGGTGVRTGTTLATIVGQAADGTPLGNHDWLFADAGFRTQNDRLVIAPTDDPCVFDVESEIYVVEGTGAYDSLTGTLQGSGYVDFCGAAGRVSIRGFLCPESAGEAE